MNKTIGFIGLGLIGGSIAKCIRQSYPETRIMAYSRTASTLDAALSEGLIDLACTKEDPAFSECNFIFLCAPVQTNIEYFPFLKRIVSSNCIITDVGSVKEIVVFSAEAAGLSAQFIGGHPMAGSERIGLSSASLTLLENAYYMLTPCSDVSKEQIEALRTLLLCTRALPLVLPASVHDYAVAGISHLPHLVAFSLVNLIQENDTKDHLMHMVAAGGFRDITRIASSSPVMWEQICMSNGTHIIDAMDSFIEILQKTRTMIETGGGDGLRALFQSAKDYRDSLNDSRPGTIARSYVLYLDLEDEPGAIATITTLLAGHSISIKNIGILNNREFEDGVLRIEFYDGDAQTHAEEVLTKRNYLIRKRS